MNIKKGDKFTHARQIAGSPRAGTAQPVVMRVTAVRGGSFYYRPDDDGTRGLWVADIANPSTVVGRWLS